MSLSDTCNDKIKTLGENIQRHTGWNYDEAYISEVIDAMFMLARIAVLFDAIIPLNDDNRSIAVSRTVVLALLTDSSNAAWEPNNDQLKMLAEIACKNVNLADALLMLDEWLTTDEGECAMSIYYPQLANVGEIINIANKSGRKLAA